MFGIVICIFYFFDGEKSVLTKKWKKKKLICFPFFLPKKKNVDLFSFFFTKKKRGKILHLHILILKILHYDSPVFDKLIWCKIFFFFHILSWLGLF